MIKIATEEDFDLVFKMALEFAKNSNYAEYIDEEKISQMILKILKSDRNESIILLYEDKGMIVASTAEFAYGSAKQAIELAWWVYPEHRKSQVGKTLLSAFEYWANVIGAKMKVLSCLDDSVAKYYEKAGYKLYEYVYFKDE